MRPGITVSTQAARRVLILAKATDGALRSGAMSTLATATFQCHPRSAPTCQKLHIKLNPFTTPMQHVVARTLGLLSTMKPPVSTRRPLVPAKGLTSALGQVASAWARRSLDNALRNSMASLGAWVTAAALALTVARVEWMP